MPYMDHVDQAARKMGCKVTSHKLILSGLCPQDVYKRQIFNCMHKQGWYPVKQAKQEDITQAKEKAEQLKTSLQA